VHTAGTQFAGLISGSVGALGRFFSPSGLTRWTKYVVTNDGTAGSSTSKPAAPIVAIGSHTPPAASNEPVSASAPENNRILSIVGVLRLGSQAGGAGAAIVLFLLALINIFLGLLNLVPLPPFDGGHAAVATYEAVREKLSGRPYRADMAKLIPVTYAVLALMGFIFVSSTYLDLLHPAQNPFKSP
jgi:membrane-associated protease RseP (regulator of RpoE activity)